MEKLQENGYWIHVHDLLMHENMQSMDNKINDKILYLKLQVNSENHLYSIVCCQTL